jgi:TonB-linked SusC/RagA family outer membrane protein
MKSYSLFDFSYSKNKADFSVFVKIVAAMMLFFALSGFRGSGWVSGANQPGRVSGTITNVSGEPLPGATVMIKGTNRGTVADVNGIYILEGVAPDDILVYSFIGMKSREIRVENRTTLDVALEEDVIGLDEVVAIGYGVVKKRDLTGAVSVVKNEDIVRTPTNNAIEAIQGMVTGMTITRESGAAGASVDILVRGNRSINGSNAPLFIIDGVQGANFEDINVSDIESINVLKDASSTAIYGSQGANGVIIITTKKGQSGELKVAYNGYYGINGMTRYPDVRTGEDYIQLRREANRTAGLWESSADDPTIFTEHEWNAIQNDKWVNWQDLLLHNGTLQNHSVTISGGTEKTQSLVSLAYLNEGGMYKNDNLDKFMVRLNLNHNLTDWAKAGINSQLTYYNLDRRKDPIKLALYTSPFGEPYDENGNINLYPIGGNTGIISPLADEIPDMAADDRISTNNNLGGYLEINPLKGLDFKSNLAVNLYSYRRGVYNASHSISLLGGTCESSYSSSTSQFINWDNILTYEKDFGAHNVKITGLTSWIRSISDNATASGNGQLLASQLFYYLQGNTTESKETTSGYTEYSSFSVAGRINYSYKDKYLLTATTRYDGASRLAEGNKWYSFPSVAVAWRVSEENFLKNSTTLSNLKLRASYGIAGNSAIAPYGTQSSMYLSTNFAFGDVTAPYYVVYLFGNDQLGWEKSATLNVGADIGLFNNHISLTADYYQTKTSDILLSRSLPWSTGGKNKQVYQNIGASENNGMEFTVNTLNFNRKAFKWTTNLTFTRSREKITSLIDDEDIIYGGKQTSLIIGEPIQTWYNYVFDGIWQTDEQEEMDLFNANGHSFQPGDIKVKDLRGPDDEEGNPTPPDYRITGDDRIPVGSRVPKWEGGLGNTFQIRNFDFSFFLYARMGQTIWGEFLGRYNPDGQDNGPAAFDYWTPENPSNEYPRPDANKSSIVNYSYSDMLMFADGSYIKLRNVSLGYSLPAKLLDRIFIRKARFYVTGSNLATWVKDKRLKQYDPERGGSESSPLSRQVIFGVNVEF